MVGRDATIYWAPQTWEMSPHTHLVVVDLDGCVSGQRHGRFVHYMGKQSLDFRPFCGALYLHISSLCFPFHISFSVNIKT